MKLQAAALPSEEERWGKIVEDNGGRVSARRTLVVRDCLNMMYLGFCDISGDVVPDARHFVKKDELRQQKKKYIVPPGGCTVAWCAGGGEVSVCNENLSPDP